MRPDRQITFDGLPHNEWPEPNEDRDTITVDRIGEDIDGSSHRFIIRRGDTVEAFFRRDKTEIGQVVGISIARRQVSVRFRDCGNGIEFSVGQIYPAPETSPEQGTTAPLSAIVEQASQPPAGGFTEADRVAPARDSQSQGMESLASQQRPFLLTDYRTFLERLDADEITIDELRAEFARLTQSHDEFVTALQKDRTADQLKRLAGRFGCFDANRNSKKKNAEHVYRVVLQGFTLSQSVAFQPMKETMDEAVARIVDGLTADDLAQHLAERKQEREDREQAETDPQTLDQFRIYLRQHSYRDLNNEQQDHFDRLHADQTRPARRERRRKSTVQQIESDGAEGLELTIIEGFHSKQNIPLWICQLSTRVDRSTYNELKSKAKQLGGWYSSFVRGQEGFQFKTADAAVRFQKLLAGNVDRRDILADRKTRKMESASERLVSVAETLETEAAEILDADDGKLKNTVRRAEMAAGMRGRAYADQAMTRTLRSVAESLTDGGATYLDGLRARTHIETLIGVLRRGKRDRNTELMKPHESDGMWDRHNAREELDNRPMAVEDVAFTEYPYPNIYKRHLEEAVAVAAHKNGLKQRTRQMQSHLACTKDFVPFVDDSDVAFLQEFVDRCKSAGIETRWIESGMDDHKRLRAADIHTPHEMRCALRELLPHLQRKREDDPIRKLEEQLIGTKIPGFFPTPRPIISRMLELAGIQPGERVLEPSAGKGDILDMIRQHHPDAMLHGIEYNAMLLELLDRVVILLALQMRQKLTQATPHFVRRVDVGRSQPLVILHP